MTIKSISRRQFINSIIGGVAYLGLPAIACAKPMDNIIHNLSSSTEEISNECRLRLLRKAQYEANLVIKEALDSEENRLASTGRPEYWTKYLSPVKKYTGWHTVRGIPKGGIRIASGGSIFISLSGGGTTNVTVSLGGGLGSISVGLPLTKYGHHATGVSIDISGNGFYTVDANIGYVVSPYVVYEKKNGNTRVYAKSAVKELDSKDFNSRRVG